MLHWHRYCRLLVLCAFAAILLGGSLSHAQIQGLSKRIILKDGSFQLATKYEVKGDRVRYLSAERGEWEELPTSIVDWDATDKFEKDRGSGAPTPEAKVLDKELEEEQKAEEAKQPHVAPGLRLPEEGGVLLLDSYQGQSQLVELEQSDGEISKNTKSNILRAAINPLASAKQTIELPGIHAKTQAHTKLPTVYVNVLPPEKSDAETRQQPEGPQQAFDRFKIVRMQTKNGKRIVGDIKIAIYGKVSQEQKLVATDARELTGGWVKVTPTAELAPGEYAVVETLGQQGLNLFVWDFGVDPNAPANPHAWKPAVPAAAKVQKEPSLEKREKP